MSYSCSITNNSHTPHTHSIISYSSCVCVFVITCVDHTNELWEMEQRQKQDKHQMLKQELREAFHMQRHQMHSRHQRVKYSVHEGTCRANMYMGLQNGCTEYAGMGI